MRRAPLSQLAIIVCAIVPLLVDGGCKKEGATTTPSEAAAPEASDADAADPDLDVSGDTGDPDDPLADIDREPEKPKITLAEQLSNGEEIYDSKCAGCHGEDGSGKKKTPAVMGSAGLPIERKGRDKFENASQVLTFVRERMPPKKGGSLSDEEYRAVTAFLLKANGADMTEPLWYENADEIAVPTGN